MDAYEKKMDELADRCDLPRRSGVGGLMRRCPECGSMGPFLASAAMVGTVVVEADGSLDGEAVWGAVPLEDSPATCMTCDATMDFKDFKE